MEQLSREAEGSQRQQKEEVERLGRMYEEEAGRTEELCRQVNQLTAVNLRLMEQQQTSCTIEEEDACEESIRNGVDLRIKQTYLTMLTKKAHSLTVLRQTQGENRQRWSKATKKLVFETLVK